MDAHCYTYADWIAKYLRYVPKLNVQGTEWIRLRAIADKICRIRAAVHASRKY